MIPSIQEHIESLFKEGFNIIPVNSQKKPLVTWKEWQNKAIPEEVFEKWKNDGLFRTGFAIITGSIWRGPYEGKYLVCIDIDNKKGIEEFLSNFTEIKSLDDLSELTMVVEHEGAINERAHIYFITDFPITKRCGINGKSVNNSNSSQIPIMEVKANSSTYVVGPLSLNKTGCKYQIKGTDEIKILDKKRALILEQTLEKIYQKYQSKNSEVYTNGI
jgi:Bifunctional DNA primase/polymerase, N-terminal